MEPNSNQGSSPPSSPSSPLSVLSKSPSLPPSPRPIFLMESDAAKRYPSPSSSAIPSGSASPIKLPNASDEICVRTDGPPPAKRRRIAISKTRTTKYVDLDSLDDESEAQLDRLESVLRKKKKIVVIAGAGISVSAGIPDFRSSTGLFSTLRGQHKLKASGKHLFDASVYRHDSSTSSFHTMVRELAHMTKNAKPTAFHHLLASIAEEGRLMRLYSQNVDCIDTCMKPLATSVPLNAKGPWPLTIQLHGGLEKMVCTKCGHLEAFDGSLFEGPEPPLCEKCREHDEVRTAFAGKRSHGIGRLRPRIVLYNEYNPDEEAIGNVTKADLRRVPDAVIVVGTSLKIPGVRRIVKEMCQVTRSRRDGFTAWINLDPEPQGVEFKDCWDLILRGKCDTVAKLVALPHWDEQDIGSREDYMVKGDDKKEKLREERLGRDTVDVLLCSKRPLPSTDENLSSSQASSQVSSSNVVVELKSRLVQQAQSGGIPTPSASPKMRSPLPDGPRPKGQPKQSKLVFAEQSSERSNPTTPPRAAPTKRPRQPKKAVKSKPKIDLKQTFKATKRVSAPLAVAVEVKKEISLEPESSSDHSSPIQIPMDIAAWGLPPLRPKAPPGDPMAYKLENEPSSSDLSFYTAPSLPTTPRMHQETVTVETVSPNSKPHSMGHLID